MLWEVTDIHLQDGCYCTRRIIHLRATGAIVRDCGTEILLAGPGLEQPAIPGANWFFENADALLPCGAGISRPRCSDDRGNSWPDHGIAAGTPARSVSGDSFRAVVTTWRPITQPGYGDPLLRAPSGVSPKESRYVVQAPPLPPGPRAGGSIRIEYHNCGVDVWVDHNGRKARYAAPYPTAAASITMVKPRSIARRTARIGPMTDAQPLAAQAHPI